MSLSQSLSFGSFCGDLLVPTTFVPFPARSTIRVFRSRLPSRARQRTATSAWARVSFSIASTAWVHPAPEVETVPIGVTRRSAQVEPDRLPDQDALGLAHGVRPAQVGDERQAHLVQGDAALRPGSIEPTSACVSATSPERR